MLFVDLIYLSLFGKSFQNLVSKIQKKPFELNILGVIGSYFLIASALYYFVVKDERPILDAFLLGIFLYGVFDFTNLAIFKDYDLKIGLIDTLWGGILLTTVTFLTYKITSYL
tara:strand:+ start:59 stop:397 length:339 start_codon:yes stop_codon:yes gene_type:complete